MGVGSRNIRNGQISNITCWNCHAVSKMTYSVYGKFFTFWAIPVFPAGKVTVVECNSCKKTFEYIGVQEDIRKEFQKIKATNPVKYPVWMYSGVLVLLGLIGFGFYESYRAGIDSAVYIKNPMAGDVYYINNLNSHYSSVRVDKVIRTEVYLTYNNYETNTDYTVDRIDVPENYSNAKDTLTVLQLQVLFKNKTIFQVVRN